LRTSIGIDCSRREKVAAVIALDPGLPPSGPRPSTVERADVADQQRGAVAQGFTLENVKNLLGHSSIVLTSNTYGHLAERRQQQVARGMDAVLGG